MKLRFISFMLAIVVAAAASVVAQQTGTLTGTVRDEQGGVLPGATVIIDSPALIGGSQSAVSGETGTYLFRQLPPGEYTVRFEMAGFTSLIREKIIINVAKVTTLDAKLAVGRIEETVTVTGESPVVDVRSTVTQTNVEEELYETIPTGRNPWVMAGLVPGVVTGRLDVGGTEGMQQYSLEVFGSADSQKSFSIDGLKTNWPGSSGGSTMQYYDFGMYEEYNFQSASGTAESDVAGVYMNMVTRSGGNNLSSSHVIHFMNESTQGDNVDDKLRNQLGLAPGEETGIAGNPIDISYDWNSTIGGPIVPDRAWFFGSFRWWRLDQFQIGARNPDGSQAIDDNRILNGMGKVSYQATPAVKLSFMFNRNQKTRFHRRDEPYLFVEDKASILQDQPAQNFVFDYNHVIGSTGFFDVRFGRMWGTFPSRYQDEVQPSDIAVRDIVRFTRINAAEQDFQNPNHRWQLNTSYSWFTEKGGTHDLKAGLQVSRERMQYIRLRNGDVLLEMSDGVPFTAQLSNTPLQSDQRVNTWGAFVQDSWVLANRLTLNLGVRFDGIHGFVPAQTSPAGTFVAERNFAKIDDTPDWPVNAAPRLGFAYDVFGNGRTAVKAYYGRFYNQIGSQIPEAVNPNAFSTSTVEWNDLDGDGMLTPGPSGGFADSPELGPFTGFVGGATTRYDTDAERPYSDEFNIGVSHTVATDLSIDVSYHRRQHRRGLGLIDRARPPEAYTAETRGYTDPIDGPNQTITIYNLVPALRAERDRVLTNVPELESDYDGVHIQMTKRMSKRWQLLAGLTLQKHEGFFHDGTFTNEDFNNPNVRINREGARIFSDLPWVLTISGSYQLPYDVTVAAKYTGRDGSPLRRRATFGGLTQASETVDVVPRGTDRTEDIDQFVDLRFNKGFDLGGTARLEAMVDVFNLLNANHVLLQTDRIGSTFGRPSRILAPRIVRFGARFSF